MQLGEQSLKHSSAETFVLLAVAAFVALAPLCSVAASLPEGSVAMAGPANHELRAGQHEAPAIGVPIATTRDDHSDARCAEYSCCTAAELTNSAASRQNDNVAALAVVATVAPVSNCRVAHANVAGPALPHAAVRLIPLRL